MSWVDLLVNSIGNNLLPKTTSYQVGIIADPVLNPDNQIIYSYNNKEILPANHNSLLGFHVIDNIIGNEAKTKQVIKAQNWDVLLSLVLVGNEKLDRSHVMDIVRIISRSALINCKGISNPKTQILSISTNTPALILKYFASYQQQLAQKQTGLRIYEIQYKINVNQTH